MMTKARECSLSGRNLFQVNRYQLSALMSIECTTSRVHLLLFSPTQLTMICIYKLYAATHSKFSYESL